MNTLPLNLACCTLALSCGGAFAQSNVTVYGLVDMNAGHITHASPEGGGVMRVGSGGMNTSRLGFSGSEDLGGGLKATFQLEMGIAADTGVADTPLFKRQANVGLAGRYGSLTLGRTFTSVYDFVLPFDPMGYAPAYSWAPTGNGTGTSKYGMTLAFDNMVKYSGKFGPVSFGASYGAGEQSSAADGRKAAVAASLGHGPVSVVATYERVNDIAAPATGARTVTTAWHVGAMLSGERFKLQAAMRDYRQEPGDALTPEARARLYWLGANYLATPAVTLTGAVYYQDVRNVPARTDADPAMVVGRIRYALSKRTDLYMVAAYAKAKHGQPVSLARDEVGYGSRQRSILAGIQHRF